MTRKHKTGIPRPAVLLAAALLLSAGAVQADVKGTIVTKGDNRQLSGTIRWMPMSKIYSITGRNNVSMKIPLQQVDEVRVAQPPELAAAIRLVQQGKHSRGAKALEEIAEDYRMLQWDEVATQWLVRAYLGMDKPDDAVAACQKIINLKPEAAFTGDIAPMYWEALLQAGSEASLKRILTEAVQRGDRDLAAKAQVKRGDIDRKAGNFKDALVDGYLRTIILFEGVKSVQPEALFKAMQCFEELGQMSYAEKMRSRLLNKFPESKYAQSVQAGR